MSEAEDTGRRGAVPAVVGVCAIICIVVGTFGHGAPGLFLKVSDYLICVALLYVGGAGSERVSAGMGVIAALAAVVTTLTVLGTSTAEVHGPRLAFLVGMVMATVAASMVYDPRGSHSAEGEWKNGKRDGEWSIYEGSRLVRSEVYDEGTLLRWTNWDEAGRPIERSETEPARTESDDAD